VLALTSLLLRRLTTSRLASIRISPLCLMPPWWLVSCSMYCIHLSQRQLSAQPLAHCTHIGYYILSLRMALSMLGYFAGLLHSRPPSAYTRHYPGHWLLRTSFSHIGLRLHLLLLISESQYGVTSFRGLGLYLALGCCPVPLGTFGISF
jgi:hypothetical protein